MANGIDISKLKKKSPSISTTGLKVKGSNKTVSSDDWNFMDYVPDVLRGAAGFAPGGYIGAGAGGAAEALARFIEGKEFSPAAMGTAAAFGAIPFRGVPSAARAALRGLGLTGGQTLAMQQAEKGIHVPTKKEAKEAAISGAIGATAGAATEKILPKVLPKIFGKETPTVKVGEEPSVKVTEPTVTTPAVAPTIEPVVPAVTPALKVKPTKIELPPELKKSSPKFGAWSPSFNNDLDKALFIVRRESKGQSKSHDKYMGFLREMTGLDDEAIYKAATQVHGNMKTFLGKQKEKGGSIDLPRMHKLDMRKLIGRSKARIEGQEPVEISPVTGRPIVKTAFDPTTGKIDLAAPTTPPVKLAGGEPPIPPSKPPGGPSEPPEGIPPVNISEQAPSIEPSLMDKALKFARQIPAEGRQLMTFGDFSFPFRQGITNIHKGEFWNSFIPMFRSALKEGNFEALLKEIRSNPYYKDMLKAKLDITGREEQLKGVLLEGIGKNVSKFWNPIRGSNRAYQAFAYKLRTDLFTSMVENAKKAGIEVGEKEFKAIARYVNDTTGRGHLGKYEASAESLNELLFAPKLIASRVNMFRRLLPKSGGLIGDGVDPRLANQLRKEAVKSMASVGALGLTATGLSKLMNEDTATDLTSPDLAKIKTGKTRIDITGGFQPYVRTAFKVASELADTKAKTRDTAGATAQRFIRNKLSPAASLIADWWYEETPIGEKFEPKKAFMDRVTPLIAQDLIDIYHEDKKMLPLTVPASLFGATVSAYGKDKPKVGAVNPRVYLP